MKLSPGINKVEFESCDSTLKGIIYLPEGSFGLRVPGIVLCHGLTNRRHYCPLIEDSAIALRGAGFITLQFDFFGSGESDGEFKDKRLSILEGNLASALDWFKQVPQVDPSRIGLWGRSIGGTLAAIFSPYVASTVIISPGYKLTKSFASWNNSVNSDGYIALPVEEYNTSRRRDIKGEWKLNPNYFKELGEYEEKTRKKATSGRNVAFMQGNVDKTVEWTDTRELYTLFQSPKQFNLIGNAGHNYEGYQNLAIDTLVRWFKLCLIGEELQLSD